MQISLLPREVYENAEFLTFKHPRNDKEATFIRSRDKIFELFQVDKSHSSWFVGNSVVSNGSLLYGVEINPLFIVLPFVASRGKQMFSENEFFYDTPYQPIADITKKKLHLICQTMDMGDEIQLNYDPNKASQWLVTKTEKLLPFVTQSNKDLADYFLIEIAYSIIRHYLSNDIAETLKGLLHDKYPGSFPTKREADYEIVHEEVQKSPKKPEPKRRKKMPPAEGMMSISSFFAPSKSKK